MGKTIDKEAIEQIPILYGKLKSKAAVARELGITSATVARYLKLYEAAPDGVIEQKERKKPLKITPEIEEEINKRYKECKNMSQVARELGTTPTTVKAHLNEENLELVKNQYDDRDALFFYIYRLFGPVSDTEPVSKWNLTQMQKFKQQGYTYQGQLLTLKYFFEIKKSPLEKAHGSIGIIPFQYESSRLYYINQAKKADEITAAIHRQLEKDRIEINIIPSEYFGRKKKKKTIDLNSIEG